MLKNPYKPFIQWPLAMLLILLGSGCHLKPQMRGAAVEKGEEQTAGNSERVLASPAKPQGRLIGHVQSDESGDAERATLLSLDQAGDLPTVPVEYHNALSADAEQGIEGSTSEPAEIAPDRILLVTTLSNARGEDPWHEQGVATNIQLSDLSLADAISIALSDVDVLRSLNATIVTNPQAVASFLDPSIIRYDPIRGYEAALSAFDPTFNTNALYSKNDDVFNNPVLGSGANEIRDDVTELESGLGRVGRYGTLYSLRSNLRNSDSNNPSLLFQDSWTSEFESSITQPLLQGRGRVNQILGPNAQPGIPNNRGILLAISDTEVAKLQYKAGLRNMVLEVAQSYWELEAAYRRLEASIAVQELARETWQAAKARYEQGLAGGGADEEALARAQYYRISSQVNADIRGDRADGQLGVLQAEANLRRLLSLPSDPSDYLYPSDLPLTAPVLFSLSPLRTQAIANRIEVEQQLKRIEQLQLEICGLKNLLLPRLDLVMRLRSNGFGDDLAGSGPRFTSAFQDAFSGDHFESEFGMSYELPVRFRQAKAAVSNARLRLAREHAVLEEQQNQIQYEVQKSLQAVYRHQKDLLLQQNRLQAAEAATESRLAAFETGVISIDELLIVQQQLLESKRAYLGSVLAIQRSRLQLDFQTGNLLREHAVGLMPY